MLFYGNEADTEVDVGMEDDGIAFSVISIDDSTFRGTLHTTPALDAPEIPKSKAYTGRLPMGTEVRVDAIHELSDTKLNAALKLRARVCIIAGKQTSGWLAARVLTCEDGICGFCKVCNSSMVHARLPSVMMEAERQQQANTDAVQAEMTELRRKLKAAEDKLAEVTALKSKLKAAEDELRQQANQLGHSSAGLVATMRPSSLALLGPPPSRVEDVLARLSLEVQLRLALASKEAAEYREQLLREGNDGKQILKLQCRVLEQREALAEMHRNTKKAALYDEAEASLSRLRARTRAFASAHSL